MISIHTSPKGSDISDARLRRNLKISIHTSPKGSDSNYKQKIHKIIYLFINIHFSPGEFVTIKFITISYYKKHKEKNVRNLLQNSVHFTFA